MKDWQQAFWLTKFEFKFSKVRYLLFLAIIVIFLIVSDIPNYFLNNERVLQLDAFFLLVFAFFGQWSRPKTFQIQKISGPIWVTHFIITLKELSVTKKVIIKYRLLSFVILSLLSTIVFATCLYIFSPSLKSLMSIDEYLVFSFVWCCLAIVIGNSQLISDVGTNIIINIAIAIFVFTPLFLVIVVLFFYKIYPQGFVYWTMFLTKSYPLWTIISSLLLVIISSAVWMKLTHRKINRADYF